MEDGLGLDYLRDRELELRLAPGELARRVVAFETGGRIAVVARDPDGKALPAAVELRDAHGVAVEIELVARTGSASFFNTWRLSTEAPNETTASLAPGDYELRLRHVNFAPAVTPVRVEPGATARLDVVLERE